MEVTFPRALPTLPGELYQACIPAEWGVEGETQEGREKGQAGSCYGHVCISKTRRKDEKKRITVDIFSLLKDACVTLPCIVTFSDQCIHAPRKS